MIAELFSLLAEVELSRLLFGFSAGWSAFAMASGFWADFFFLLPPAPNVGVSTGRRL